MPCLDLESDVGTVVPDLGGRFAVVSPSENVFSRFQVRRNSHHIADTVTIPVDTFALFAGWGKFGNAFLVASRFHRGDLIAPTAITAGRAGTGLTDIRKICSSAVILFVRLASMRGKSRIVRPGQTTRTQKRGRPIEDARRGEARRGDAMRCDVM